MGSGISSGTILLERGDQKVSRWWSRARGHRGVTRQKDALETIHGSHWVSAQPGSCDAEGLSKHARLTSLPSRKCFQVGWLGEPCGQGLS